MMGALTKRDRVNSREGKKRNSAIALIKERERKCGTSGKTLLSS